MEADRQKKGEQAAVAERKKKDELEATEKVELRRKREHEKAKAERLRRQEEENKNKEEEDAMLENIEVSPLEVPLVSTRATLFDVSSSQGQEVDVFDLTRLTCDQFSSKI